MLKCVAMSDNFAAENRVTQAYLECKTFVPMDGNRIRHLARLISRDLHSRQMLADTINRAEAELEAEDAIAEVLESAQRMLTTFTPDTSGKSSSLPAASNPETLPDR